MKMRSVAPMKIAKIGYIVVSVLFCIAGILFIALPEISTKIVGIEIGIAAVFGIAILFDGLFKIRIALDSKRFGIKDWWLILSLAILAGIIGVALIFDSAFGAGVLTILMGVSLFPEGILNLYTVIRTVLIVENQVPDFVETDTIGFFEKDR